MTKNFAKGVSVKGIKTQYGEMIKVGVKLEKICENDCSNGWLNFNILRSKEGNLYAVISEYKQKEATEQKAEVQETEIKEDEIPF
jgi:hypothetical protein